MARPVSDNWTLVLEGLEKYDRLRCNGEDEILRINVVDVHASTPSESQSNLFSKCPVLPKMASYFKFSCAQGDDDEVAHFLSKNIENKHVNLNGHPGRVPSTPAMGCR